MDTLTLKGPLIFAVVPVLFIQPFLGYCFTADLQQCLLESFFPPSSTLFPQPEIQELLCRHIHWSRLPMISALCSFSFYVRKSFGEIWWPHLHEDVRIRFRMWEGLCWSNKMSVIDCFLRSMTSLALGNWQFLVATNMWMPLLALVCISCRAVLVVVYRCWS